ncbi:MAG: hypothetical protein PHQ43_05200 [Dehalococcoidales bacterium]|nr:hypothetical protein [Dehalococcoidales bacterium]
MDKLPGGMKQRLLPGNWEQATNRQQRRLTRTYDEWSTKTRKKLVEIARSGGTIQEQSQYLDRALRELELKLKEVYDRGIDIAKNLSGGTRSDIPELQSLAESRKQEGNNMIAAALIPAMSAKLTADLARGIATNPAALKAAFNTTRSMPPQYSGGFWVMIFDTQKTLGRQKERERAKQGLKPEKVRWVLDSHAQHCQHSPGFYGCPELAGEYKNWDSLPTVPAGQVTCRGNCRCHLEVFRDGQWRRGVYDD